MARERLHGITELAQPVHVAPNGPLVDFQTFAQIPARPVPARLKQRESRNNRVEVGSMIRSG